MIYWPQISTLCWFLPECQPYVCKRCLQHSNLWTHWRSSLPPSLSQYLLHQPDQCVLASSFLVPLLLANFSFNDNWWLWIVLQAGQLTSRISWVYEQLFMLIEFHFTHTACLGGTSRALFQGGWTEVCERTLFVGQHELDYSKMGIRWLHWTEFHSPFQILALLPHFDVCFTAINYEYICSRHVYCLYVVWGKGVVLSMVFAVQQRWPSSYESRE